MKSKRLRTPIQETVLAAALVVGAASPGRAEIFWHGFFEGAGGVKISNDQTKRDNFNLFEQRAQLKTSYFFEGKNYLTRKRAALNFKGDVTVDEYFNGKTGFDLRELNLALSPSSAVDMKMGRQVLTWGTGEYLFINDLFPKDYVSFFTGRDDEYLKKPSDALKASLYRAWGNVDVVVSAFEPNTQPEGDRLSFFDPFQGGIAGVNADRDLLEPPLRFSNNEYHLRFFRSLGSHELALYYFRWFDKNAGSTNDESARQLFSRRLDVYGWSVRGPFSGGIGNLEFGYYNSRDDSGGTNRLIENSMVKVLSGYEKDLGHDFKAGVQYLFEQRRQYDDYEAGLLPADFVFDEFRHLVTQRLTKLYKNQTVTVFLFNFYSPSDRDGYVRPGVAYQPTDPWNITLGANIPWGEDEITEFGQMKRNKNIDIRARYSF